MRRIITVLVLAAVLPACAVTSDATLEARQSLKNYGLSLCLLEAYPQPTAFKDDVRAARGAYHFMGRGKHRIVQDEDTLETLYDPYAEVAGYVRRALVDEPAVMKQGGENAFAGCMQIHGSPAFNELVRGQDGYIEE